MEYTAEDFKEEFGSCGLNWDKISTIVKDSNKVKAYYYGGQPLAEFSLNDNNKMHGEIKKWHANGEVHMVYSCQNNKMHGEIKAWFDNKQPSLSCVAEDGQLIGEFKTWKENGDIDQNLQMGGFITQMFATLSLSTLMQS